MQTTAISAAINSATAITATKQSKTSTDIGSKDVFLKLLVAQLQYQDPLKPQDPTQMTAQLSRFNMVEQQINTNKLLTNMSTNGTAAATQAATAASYLGHQAVVNSNQIQYDGSTPANIVVQAPKGATTASVQILNNFGQVVKTLNSGLLSKGDTPLTWDGTQDNGTPAGAGHYTVAVKALDARGKAVTTSIQVIAKVQAVRPTATGVKLVVGGIPISMKDIQEIRL